MSAWHIYVIQLTEQSPLSRAELFAKLQERKIGCQVHYIPVHWHPYYQELGFKQGRFSNSVTFYNHCLTLPLYPEMERQEEVIDSLVNLL